jgi:hypothetical protein
VDVTTARHLDVCAASTPRAVRLGATNIAQLFRCLQIFAHVPARMAMNWSEFARRLRTQDDTNVIHRHQGWRTASGIAAFCIGDTEVKSIEL